MSRGDAYRELANLCRKRRLRLCLCGDQHRSPMTLTTLDVRNADELVARVSLREHTLDTAAAVVLLALEKAGIR